MALGHVPVDTSKEFVVGLVAGEVGVGTGVVSVLGLHILLDGLKVGESSAGDIAFVLFSTLVGAVLDDLAGLPGGFVVDEEEEFVLDDGAAEGEAVDGLGLFGAVAKILTVDLVTAEILVLEI